MMKQLPAVLTALCYCKAFALDASPTLPLAPMFPTYLVPQPQPLGLFPSLFGGLEKILEGTASKLASASGGSWEQNDTQKKITITGNLPIDFDANTADVQTQGKEITISIKKLAAKREEADGKPAVATEDDFVERTFDLPFEVKASDIRKDASGNILKIEIDVPIGVTVQPRVHSPRSSMSSFQYHSGGPNGLSMGSSKSFVGETGNVPLSSLMGPLFANHPLFPRLALADNTIPVNQATLPALYGQQNVPETIPKATSQLDRPEDNPFLPTMPKQRNPFDGFGNGFGGFGGLLWPMLQNPYQQVRSFEPENTLGEWTQSVTPQQVVIVGALPANGDPSKVHISISGRKLTIKEMSQSHAKKQTKNGSNSQGVIEDDQSQSEKQIFTLPVETDMSKVQKSIDNQTKKITLTIPVPAGVTVEESTNIPMHSSESFSHHSFSSDGASGTTYSRSFYGSSMF